MLRLFFQKILQKFENHPVRFFHEVCYWKQLTVSPRRPGERASAQTVLSASGGDRAAAETNLYLAVPEEGASVLSMPVLVSMATYNW